MILIFCVDDRMGIAFNHRRQSRDSEVVKRITERSRGSILRMGPASAKLFSDADVTVSEDYLAQAQEGEYCFAELTDPATAADRAEQLIVYRWNRHYPNDVRCTIDLGSWNKISGEEFAGSSHETITEEIYTR